MKSPPFKTNQIEVKKEYFTIVVTNFNKVTNYEDLLKKIDEDEAITLLQYGFKAMELYHRKEEAIMKACDSNKYIAYLNQIMGLYRTRAIM